MSANFDVDLRDFKKFTNEILSEMDRTTPFITDVLDAMANHLINLIRTKAPKKTGEYARSWTSKKGDGANQRIVSTFMSDLYIILEFRGADPHDIEAGILSGKSGKRALHYTDEKGIEHFYVKVRHKGQDNQPHVRPATDQLKRDMPTIVFAAAAIHFKKIFGRTLRPHLSKFNNSIGVAGNSGIRVDLKPVKTGT